LFFDVFDPGGDGSVGACFGDFHDSCRDGIQVDVSADGQERFFVEDRDAFEPSFEERAAGFVLAIGQA
jgi:hypothetical protein